MDEIVHAKFDWQVVTNMAVNDDEGGGFNVQTTLFGMN